LAKILITGATGFIGSHLAERLLSEGQEVWALIRREPRWLPEGVKLIRGDLRGKLPPLRGFHHVFHLAGLTRAKHPGEYFKVNRTGTERLLEALEASGGITGRFLYLSSLAAAGPSTPSRPRKEEDPPRPVSPYGRSKLEAEGVALGHRDSLQVGILRAAAVYGPRDDYMLQLFRLVKGRLVPMLRREQWLSLCFVRDLVEALILAAEADYPSGEVFFISDGVKHPLQSLIDMVASLLGIRYMRIRIPAPVAWLCAYGGELFGKLRGRAVAFTPSKCAEALQEAWLCDISKAREVLGFSPRWSLREGLELTLAWYLKAGWL